MARIEHASANQYGHVLVQCADVAYIVHPQMPPVTLPPSSSKYVLAGSRVVGPDGYTSLPRTVQDAPAQHHPVFASSVTCYDGDANACVCIADGQAHVFPRDDSVVRIAVAKPELANTDLITLVSIAGPDLAVSDGTKVYVLDWERSVLLKTYAPRPSVVAATSGAETRTPARGAPSETRTPAGSVTRTTQTQRIIRIKLTAESVHVWHAIDGGHTGCTTYTRTSTEPSAFAIETASLDRITCDNDVTVPRNQTTRGLLTYLKSGRVCAACTLPPHLTMCGLFRSGPFAWRVETPDPVAHVSDAWLAVCSMSPARKIAVVSLDRQLYVDGRAVSTVGNCTALSIGTDAVALVSDGTVIYGVPAEKSAARPYKLSQTAGFVCCRIGSAASGTDVTVSSDDKSVAWIDAGCVRVYNWCAASVDPPASVGMAVAQQVYFVGNSLAVQWQLLADREQTLIVVYDPKPTCAFSVTGSPYAHVVAHAGAFKLVDSGAMFSADSYKKIDGAPSSSCCIQSQLFTHVLGSSTIECIRL